MIANNKHIFVAQNCYRILDDEGGGVVKSDKTFVYFLSADKIKCWFH